MSSEDELLMSYAQDRLRLCDENCMLTNTKFLDIRQQSVIYGRFTHDKRCNLFFYGGYPDSERAVAVFVPPVFGIETTAELDLYLRQNPDNNPLKGVRVVKDRFSSALSHRDYLGALMSLGIKRDIIGDIIVCEDGCDLILSASIAGYIADNLTLVARSSVKVSEIALSELRCPEERYDECFHSVASMRLDALTAAVFKLSRTAAVEAICNGSVYVNGLQTEKSDYRLCVGDKLVLRGKGKAVISELLGESKKGRQRLTVRIYK